MLIAVTGTMDHVRQNRLAVPKSLAKRCVVPPQGVFVLLFGLYATSRTGSRGDVPTAICDPLHESER